METVTFTKYSEKAIAKLEKAGTPYKLFNKKNCSICRIVAKNCGTNNDQLAVEIEYRTGDDVQRNYIVYFDINGKCYDDQLYIWTGGIDIQKGDIIKYTFGDNESFYFYYIFDNIVRLEGSIGLSLYMGMDMNGNQFSDSMTFHEIGKTHTYKVEKASDADVDIYTKHLNNHGYYWKPDGGLRFVPGIGQTYYTIEMENGAAIVQEKCAKIEAERPFWYIRIYMDKSLAEWRAKKINEVLK